VVVSFDGKSLNVTGRVKVTGGPDGIRTAGRWAFCWTAGYVLFSIRYRQPGASLNRIRQIIAVNLPLGLLVVVIGASGRYLG